MILPRNVIRSQSHSVSVKLGQLKDIEKTRDFRLTMGLFKVNVEGRSIYFKDKQIIDL